MTHEVTGYHGLKPAIEERYRANPEGVVEPIYKHPFVRLRSQAALLEQIADRRICAGIDNHSYISFHRLSQTRMLIRELFFGDVEEAIQAAKQINTAHHDVKGTTDEGVSYNAKDAELISIVWATLAWSTLSAYENCVEPLTLEQKDAYIQENTARIGLIGGKQKYLPNDFAALNAFFISWHESGNIEVNSTTLALKSQIFNPVPKMEFLTKHFAGPQDFFAAGFMHPVIREQYYPNWKKTHRKSFETTCGILRATSHFIH